VAHVADPDRTLLAQIRFSGARLIGQTCRQDAGAYVCRADYEFAAAPEKLDVECRLASVTVANHVHLLRAEMDGKRDQALLDLSFPKATLRFKPPPAAEAAMEQAGAGFLRALGGVAQISFLAALVVAARSRRELLAMALMFVGGQCASTLLLPLTNWQPPARFIEAAAALTIAYLAVEVLALPKAQGRWIVAGVLGAFHGLYFALFLATSGYRAGWVLGGAAIADLVAIALIALAFSRFVRLTAVLRPVQISAAALLIFAAALFVQRLRG
jgi:hypothetical protein